MTTFIIWSASWWFLDIPDRAAVQNMWDIQSGLISHTLLINSKWPKIGSHPCRVFLKILAKWLRWKGSTTVGILAVFVLMSSLWVRSEPGTCLVRSWKHPAAASAFTRNSWGLWKCCAGWVKQRFCRFACFSSLKKSLEWFWFYKLLSL